MRAALSTGALLGGSIRDGGKTMDPHMSALVRFVRRLPPGGVGGGIEALRAQYADAVAVSGALRPAGVQAIPTAVPLPSGTRMGCRYVPRSARGDMLVYFHGGGFIMGSPDTHAGVCALLADLTGWQVFAAPYRLAPEHPFPAAHEDADFVLRWLGEDSDGPLAVGGDSAGANLAVWASRQGRVAARLLLYPVVDMDPATGEQPSLEQFGKGYLLTTEALDQCKKLALPPGTDPADPRLSPIRGRLDGQAPTVVAVAGFDPLVDQGRMFHEALQAAGSPSRLVELEGMVHGFADFAGVVPAARDAVKQVARAFVDTARAEQQVGQA